jgi:phospholipase A1
VIKGPRFRLGSPRAFEPAAPCVLFVTLVACLLVFADLHAQKLAFKETHTLRARWELADSLRNGTFLITPYRPVYVLPAVWSSAPNRSPHRFEAPPSTDPPIPLDPVECKFQFSFKTKVVQGLFKDRGDLWVGYTQSSRWQVYNSGLSRPFRETNYEPEVMLVVPTNYRLFGVRGRLLALGLNHQSNGGGEPFSRSWNRVVLQVGLERGRYTLLLRPWLRIPESRTTDDNPDINGLVGNGEVLLVFRHKSHLASVQVRSPFIEHPFLGGSVQGDWSFTISGPLKAHLQVFHGFGESLLDYNHEQTTIGLGVSLLDWL